MQQLRGAKKERKELVVVETPDAMGAGRLKVIGSLNKAHEVEIARERHQDERGEIGSSDQSKLIEAKPTTPSAYYTHQTKAIKREQRTAKPRSSAHVQTRNQSSSDSQTHAESTCPIPLWPLRPRSLAEPASHRSPPRSCRRTRGRPGSRTGSPLGLRADNFSRDLRPRPVFSKYS